MKASFPVLILLSVLLSALPAFGADYRASIVQSAKNALGLYAIPQADGRYFTSDCIGTVRYIVYKATGVDLADYYSGGGNNACKLLWTGLTSGGLTFGGTKPRPGDLIFFNNTYDVNGDGTSWADPLSHIAVVTAVGRENTITYAHFGSGHVKESVMNLEMPQTYCLDNCSFVINSWLKRKRGEGFPDYRYMSSSFFHGFAVVPVSGARVPLEQKTVARLDESRVSSSASSKSSVLVRSSSVPVPSSSAEPSSSARSSSREPVSSVSMPMSSSRPSSSVMSVSSAPAAEKVVSDKALLDLKKKTEFENKALVQKTRMTNKYVNTPFNFSIQYPDGWKREMDAAGTYFLFSAPGSKAAFLVIPFVQNRKTTAQAFFQEMEPLLKKTYSLDENDIPEGERGLKKANLDILKAESGYAGHYQGVVRKKNMDMTFITVIAKNKAYILCMMTLADQYPAFEPVIGDILMSFRSL